MSRRPRRLLGFSARRAMPTLAWACCACLCVAGPAFAEPPNAEQLAALRPFHAAVGTWKGKGVSQTSTGWDETVEVLWGFRERDGRVSLNFYFDASDVFKLGLLTYLPETKTYRFVGVPQAGDKLAFEGVPTSSQSLRLERTEGGGDYELLEIRLAKGGSKLLYTLGEKQGTRALKRHAWTELFREGKGPEEYAGNPPCVVTGAPGRLAVTASGQTVHVNCANSQAELEAHPDRYLK